MFQKKDFNLLIFENYTTYCSFVQFSLLSKKSSSNSRATFTSNSSLRLNLHVFERINVDSHSLPLLYFILLTYDKRIGRVRAYRVGALSEGSDTRADTSRPLCEDAHTTRKRVLTL